MTGKPEKSPNDLQCGDCVLGPLWSAVADTADTMLGRFDHARETAKNNAGALTEALQRAALPPDEQNAMPAHIGTMARVSETALAHMDGLQKGFETARVDASAIDCDASPVEVACPRLLSMMRATTALGEISNVLIGPLPAPEQG